MSEEKPFAYDVFLSHNSNDKAQVRRLAERLRAAGMRVWFDEWVIRPGDDIYLAVERGLEAARALVLCLSPAALGSDWVGLERSTVLFRDPTNAGRRFIPLLLADCKLPHTLRRYKYLDYRDEPDSVIHELLLACKPRDEVTIIAPLTKTAELVIFATRKDTPQWTDFREIDLNGDWLRSLSCKIVTESPYFRFGFKLLGFSSPRIFGDGSLKSQDSNLLYHIGRNNWDRPNLGITAHDIFLSFDVNGLRLEKDRKLFRGERLLTASLELRIDSGYVASLSANGVCCISRVVPPEICRRVVMLAWGDNDDYVVQVHDLSVTTAHVL